MNRTAVITGSTGFLGKEIAFAFFRNSYNVVINYFESKQIADEIVSVMGTKAFAIKADVSRFDEVRKMAEVVHKRYDSINVLINNAGITKDTLLIKYREDDWDRVINVNLKGVFNCIKAFAPFMGNGGHIINISSYSGLKGKAAQTAYSASKAALIGLTKTVAKELAEKNIKVNAVTPGYMPSKMGISAQRALIEAKQESLLKSLSDPKDVAGFIVYLSETEKITGQVFCLESRII